MHRHILSIENIIFSRQAHGHLDVKLVVFRVLRCAGSVLTLVSNGSQLAQSSVMKTTSNSLQVAYIIIASCCLMLDFTVFNVHGVQLKPNSVLFCCGVYNSFVELCNEVARKRHYNFFGHLCSNKNITSFLGSQLKTVHYKIVS